MATHDHGFHDFLRRPVVKVWVGPSLAQTIHERLQTSILTGGRITACIEENLKDCALIGPDAGDELYRRVYGA